MGSKTARTTDSRNKEAPMMVTAPTTMTTVIPHIVTHVDRILRPSTRP